MAIKYKAEFDELIVWMEAHTREPGHIIDGCRHCEITYNSNDVILNTPNKDPWASEIKFGGHGR